MLMNQGSYIIHGFWWSLSCCLWASKTHFAVILHSKSRNLLFHGNFITSWLYWYYEPSSTHSAMSCYSATDCLGCLGSHRTASAFARSTGLFCHWTSCKICQAWSWNCHCLRSAASWNCCHWYSCINPGLCHCFSRDPHQTPMTSRLAAHALILSCYPHNILLWFLLCQFNHRLLRITDT